MATAWYYALQGERMGPVTTEELKELVSSGQLSIDDLIWRKGFPEWAPVGRVRELAELCQATDLQSAQIIPQSQPQAAQWYYARDGKKGGPVTAQYLKEKALSGKLLPTDMLWKNGLKDWIPAHSLPGLKFPVAKGEQSPPTQLPLSSVTVVETDEPFGTVEPFAVPDAHSIFDIMNDPGFVAVPAVASQKPNVGLMTIATYDEKPQRRRKAEFTAATGELGYLLAAFLVPIPVAFIMAYCYGILRYYVGLYIVWYFCILGIGAALSMITCFLTEKARFDNPLVTIGYLILLGMLVLYTAWASTITWAINSLPDEDLERRIFLVEVMIQPKMLFEIIVEVSKEMESTGRSGKPTSAIPFLILEAAFMAAAPVYVTYRRYKDS